MSNVFSIMDENPNVLSGSNGCLCSELGTQDTKGPFIVFTATETDNIHAPFPVICAGCISECAMAVEISEGQAAKHGGENETVKAPPKKRADRSTRRPTAQERADAERVPEAGPTI